MEKKKRIISYIPIIISLLFIVLVESGLVEKVKEKYYDHQLSLVAQITIEDESGQGNRESSINNYGLVAETNDYVFYTKGPQLYRSDRNFNEEVGLIANAGHSSRDTINVVGDWVFFRHGKTIERMKLDGSQMDTIFRGYSLEMHLIGNWIYFINVMDDMTIYRMDVNGQNLQALSEKDVNDMAVYEDKIYYSSEEDAIFNIKAMNLDGSEKMVLSNISTKDMVVEEGYIYYIDDVDGKLYRFKIEDGTREKLSGERIGCFCKDDKYLFYTVELPGKPAWEYKGLYRMDLDGSNILVLDGETFLDQPPLGIIEDWILYNSTDGKYPAKLKRIRKDGRDKTIM